MLRTFGIQTCTGNAQPLFGDVTTAAIRASDGSQPVVISVANASLGYQIGDRIALAPGAATSNILLIEGVDKVHNTLTCMSEGGAPVSAYANATIVALSIAAMEVIVQADNGNAGVIYVGADNTVTSAGLGSVTYEVTPSREPFRMTNSGTHNTVRTSDGWLAGGAGLKFVATAVVL